MTEKEAFLILNLIPQVGPVRLRKLFERFGSPQAILTASEKELRQVEGLGTEAVTFLGEWEKHADPAAELKAVEASGARIVTIGSEEYPSSLREIYDPPHLLYVRGSLSEKDAKGVAVVGSRDVSHYGLECAKKLSYQLAYAGISVVSGLARGIDTAAHQGALAAKGRTVAVLGSGLNEVYPPENKVLADKIVECGGAVISEFPMHTRPTPSNFPMRNRIVSGMTMGTLVVEADVKSGALITARMALDQGKQLFAVPGRIDSPRSRGCHKLIQQGARLVTDAGDILSEYEFLFPQDDNRPESRPSPVELTPVEQTLYELLGTGEEDLDTLIQKSNLPTPQVSATLLALELKRLVKQLPGKRFVKVS